MRSRLFLFVVISAGMSFAGCFCVPQQMSCDFRASGKNGCVDLLENKDSQFGNTLKTLCELEGGSFSTPTLCERSTSLGGCVCEGCSRGRSVTWIFAPGPDGGIPTVAAMQAECMRQNSPYVAPTGTP